ncbi:MAG: F0F1 ATP synthase subunit delta [candidate division NC10 bacterium]|nr:F0F1 ATP synthase subunit delta [candidate division NC10 bacterium]
MQRGRTAILVLLLAVVFGQSAPGEPAQEPVVRISQGNDLATGDPHQTVTVTDYNVLWHIYDALVRRDPAGEFAPWLATSWKTLSDTTWEFRLRSGVTFANGEPFDASAVKYNLERILDPKANLRVATWLKPISRVEVTTAQEMEPAQTQQLRHWVVTALGSEMPLQVETDPTLVAGCVMRLGSTVVENSLLRRLSQANGAGPHGR